MRDIKSLEELNYEGNPIGRDYGIKYLLIMTTKIKIIDEERVTELD